MIKIMMIILLLHTIAAVDLIISHNRYKGVPAPLIKIISIIDWIWGIQSIINIMILFIIVVIKYDDDELRAAIYKISARERGENHDFDNGVDAVVEIKESSKTPGEPAWVTKVCLTGMMSTAAIWLLALIH